jgi:hypothetical protein
MDDNFSQFTNWISIISLLAAFPIGVLANIYTPKIRTWYSLRSKEGARDQIDYLEKSIKLTDRMIAEPSFAIAKFSNTALRAITANLILLFMITFILIIIVGTKGSSLLQEISQPIKIESIFSLAIGALSGCVIAYLFSYKTLEL